MNKLSNLAEVLEGQKMFQILAKAQEIEREGKSIIHFEIGDPDFDTPQHIKEAAYDALKKGYTHYTSSSGLFELKKIAAEVTERSRGFLPDLNQLLVTPGANYQIRLALGCTVNPGNEVIIPDPSFVSYNSLIKNIGAIPVGIPLKEENEFRLNPDDVRKKITDKTKMIIINSPSNPTGAVMIKKEFEEIYDIAQEKDIWLLSDEIYARMIYGDTNTRFFSPSQIDHCNERTIIVNGFSKSYAMTGWRLGVATGPQQLIKKMGLLLESELSCVPPFIQYAGIAALKGSQKPIEEMVQEFRKRRDILVNGLNNIPGINCIIPKGAFYAFPNITRTGLTSQEFADLMLKNGVTLCPGPFFGKMGEGFVRLCYANSIDNIQEGIKRMKNALEQINHN